MWLPELLDAVAAGDIDVALTCGPVPEPAAIAAAPPHSIIRYGPEPQIL
jgi:hypothetical protein